MKIEDIAYLRMLVTLELVSGDCLDKELSCSPTLSPHGEGEVKSETDRLLAKYGYKKPSLLQKLGLKKS